VLVELFHQVRDFVALEAFGAAENVI